MNRIELSVFITQVSPWAEILITELADLGFDSFVDCEYGFQAFGDDDKVDQQKVVSETILSSVLEGVSISCSFKIIPFQNWNSKWESDFTPVYIEDFVTILAPFHKGVTVLGIPIIIQPQMSFGTGHHQTTWMMVKNMLFIKDRFIDFPAAVLDMGAGTGVLAIVAEKLGAKQVLAIDIESWSAENTIENAERNKCENIVSRCGDIDIIKGMYFDLIVANINKNILTAQFGMYSSSLSTGSCLIISGFFESDTTDLIQKALTYNLVFDSMITKETWASVIFTKI